MSVPSKALPPQIDPQKRDAFVDYLLSRLLDSYEREVSILTPPKKEITK